MSYVFRGTKARPELKVPVEDWEWFGVAGHFICAHSCKFHLCTQVGKFLVSTIGEYTYDPESFDYIELGYQRKYETMVFKAGAKCVSKDCECGLPTIDGRELGFKGYNKRGDAIKGHYAMCLKVAKGLVK